VGVGTLLFDLALLYVATTILSIPYYISTPVSFFIAVSINYAISRSHVFKETVRSWHGGYAYFILVAVGGAVLTTGLVIGLVTYFHLYYLVARVLVASIVGMGNYLINLHFNFKVAGTHA
jgi:putative flippase GtrA